MDNNSTNLKSDINSETVVFSKEEKKDGSMISKKVAIPLIVILAISTVVGVGFSIVRLNSEAKSQEEIDSLKNTVSALKKVVNENETLDVSVVEQEATKETPVASDQQKISESSQVQVSVPASNEIYVNKWGIKFTIPDSLGAVSYLFDDAQNTIRFWGVQKGFQYYPDYANPEKNSGGQGVISRVEKGSAKSGDKVVFSDDNYDYIYGHPQIVFSQGDIERNYEIEAVGLFEDMLTNDISKI